MLLADDFYEDAVGEIAFQQVNYAAFDVAFEDLTGGFGGRGGWASGRKLSVGPCGLLTCRSAGLLTCCFSHSLVHGFVGQAVGCLVAAAKGVGHLEAFKTAGDLARFIIKRAQDGAGNLVLALHLLDHQFGVGDYAEALDAVVGGPLEHA